MTCSPDRIGSADESGGPSVLVVDDEPAVRRLLGAILQGCGYRTTLAADGMEARAAVEMEDVSVILCDVHLRGESGPALAQELLRRLPHAVAFMMSGGEEAGRGQERLEDGIYGHIPKPFKFHEVVSQIAGALCSRRVDAARGAGADRLQWQ